MKKVLLSLCVAFFACQMSFGAYNAQSRVSAIGANLLNNNGIVSSNVKLELTPKTVNKTNFAKDRTVMI